MTKDRGERVREAAGRMLAAGQEAAGYARERGVNLSVLPDRRAGSEGVLFELPERENGKTLRWDAWTETVHWEDPAHGLHAAGTLDVRGEPRLVPQRTRPARLADLVCRWLGSPLPVPTWPGTYEERARLTWTVEQGSTSPRAAGPPRYETGLSMVEAAQVSLRWAGEEQARAVGRWLLELPRAAEVRRPGGGFWRVQAEVAGWERETLGGRRVWVPAGPEWAADRWCSDYLPREPKVPNSYGALEARREGDGFRGRLCHLGGERACGCVHPLPEEAIVCALGLVPDAWEVV